MCLDNNLFQLKMNKNLLPNLELEPIKNHCLELSQVKMIKVLHLDKNLKHRLGLHHFLVVLRIKLPKKKMNRNLTFLVLIRIKQMKLLLPLDYSKVLSLKNQKPLIRTNQQFKTHQLLNKPKSLNN